MKRVVRASFVVLGLAVAIAMSWGSPVSAAPSGRTVVDMAGRTVVVPDKIEKIAGFRSVGVLNAFIELMGEGSKICHDMPASFTRNDNWRFQYLFAPQIKGAPVLEDASGEILIETVMSVNPDVSFVVNKQTAKLLEDKGLCAIYIAWEELDDVKKAVTLVGEVLNQQAAAADYLVYFDEKVAMANERIGKLGSNEKKTVIYGNVGQLNQPHRIAEWWISQAGGISVTDNGRKEDIYNYEMEDLLKWNPSVIFLASTSSKGDILSDSRFAGIKAVKDDAIYGIPTVAHVWGNRTVEQPLTIFWAMNKLYPELMPREELAKEIRYFYSRFFLYNLSDEQIAEIIDGRKQ
ncbi:MAG: ABC transporter substrate-binding protein [Synergistaceae bacterium]|jgi:iron complex transport system substrate-binding protein|nr:ABC transporter substrate-binding protein [Synergistaceae bacterium]